MLIHCRPKTITTLPVALVFSLVAKNNLCGIREITLSQTKSAVQEYDAIIVGAGFSGLYQLYKFRELGLSTLVLDAGADVGGTWYWNRYPGARCDSPGYIYQYWFSEKLLDEWTWSERFPAQPETERYLQYVADKFDLRRDIQFNTRVTATVYDESRSMWQIATDTGGSIEARYVVMAVGGLSEPNMPDIPGLDDFQGIATHTSRWPKEGIDYSGKRVGVIGTGPTGIQLIQTMASETEQLTVFQRTPHYTIPMKNWHLEKEELTEIRADSDDMKQLLWSTFGGLDFDLGEHSFHELSPPQRREQLEQLWDRGDLAFWMGAFNDVFTDREANGYQAEFVREKIRARVDDPGVAEKLAPQDYAFGTRRVALENGYYEKFNQDNVTLIDIHENPVERITSKGIQTADGREHELDVIVFATGFDAGTGIYKHIDTRGRGGVKLTDVWAQDITNYLGLQVHGFPNMFMVLGPLSPWAFCNVPTCAQRQIDWISGCVQHLHEHGHDSIEPTAQAQAQWTTNSDELAAQTLLMETDSWYLGANIPGKQRRFLAYTGGASEYARICDEVAGKNYEGFVVI